MQPALRRPKVLAWVLPVTHAGGVVVAVQADRPPPRRESIDPHGHGAALLSGVGEPGVLDRAAQRLAARAAGRDPSGRAGAGGPVVVHHAGGRNPRPGTAYALLHRAGYLGVEPTLGILADGALFVQAVRVDPVAAGREKVTPVVLTSRDGGTTFLDVSPKSFGGQAHPTTQDPYLYAEPRTGRVFTADYAGCTLVSHTDDGGEGWSSAGPICGELTDHQSLFGGPPVTSTTIGYADVVYHCAATLGALSPSAGTACRKSIDGGASFVTGARLAYAPEPQYEDAGRPEGVCTGLPGHGAVAGDGTVYLPKVCDAVTRPSCG